MAVDYTSTLQVLLDLQAISETISGDRAFRSPDKFIRRGDTLSELKASNLPPKCISVSGGLKIFCLNVNSLMKHLDKIRISVDEKKPHILYLNETKIDGSIADDDIDIENYALNRKNRNCFRGGVAIYVHKSIRFKERVDLRTIELETMTIELNIPFVKPIILNTIYCPEGPVEVFNKIESLVSKIISDKEEFILLGDLNCDLLSETISKTKHLVHIYNTYGLTQVIKEATRTTAETNTLTDHIVTNKKDNIADSGIIPCGISDHDLVYTSRHARIPKIKKDQKIFSQKYQKLK